MISTTLFSSLDFLYLMHKVLFRVRKSLRIHAGDADAAAVPCGFGRAIGNKVRLRTTAGALTCRHRWLRMDTLFLSQNRH